MSARYAVGEKVIVMAYILNGRAPWVNPMYRPWEDTLDEVLSEVLTVTEHHKVAWDQDPTGEKKYNGFILENRLHQAWTNQYPTASYGQTTTSADYYFDRKYPVGTDYNQLSDRQLITYEDVCQVIDRLVSGVKFMETHNPKYGAQLKEHLDWLINEVKCRHGATVTFEPIWQDVPDVTRATLNWS